MHIYIYCCRCWFRSCLGWFCDHQPSENAGVLKRKRINSIEWIRIGLVPGNSQQSQSMYYLHAISSSIMHANIRLQKGLNVQKTSMSLAHCNLSSLFLSSLSFIIPRTASLCLNFTTGTSEQKAMYSRGVHKGQMDSGVNLSKLAFNFCRFSSSSCSSCSTYERKRSRWTP